MGNGRFVKGMKSWHIGKTKKDFPQLSHPNPEKGKKHPEHSRLLKERKIIPPSQKGSILNKGKNNPMFGRRGENSPQWKGGITSIARMVRTCFKYRQWRSDVFERDDYTCQLCGARSKSGSPIYLHCDHYPKRFSIIMREYKIISQEEADVCEELWNINNGRTLCRDCHKKVTFKHG